MTERDPESAPGQAETDGMGHKVSGSPAPRETDAHGGRTAGPGEREILGGNARTGKDTSLRRIVLDDIRHAGIHKSLRQDLSDLYRFYLTEEDRAQLAEMGRARRFFRQVAWATKSMLLRLSPARRVLIVAALVLCLLNARIVIGNTTIGGNTWPWVALLLMIVLMLELKDKLLARDEIEIARQVQLSLLPRSHPRLEGWSIWSSTRPANDVGGDLIDYLDLGERGLGIVLGDVAGKGMGAALLSARLQATLRALAPDFERLDEMGGHLNRVFYRDGLENRYATMIYLEIPPGGGPVRWINAGHNPGLLLRAGLFTRLEASSFPVGMLPVADYSEAAIEPATGDLIVLYSDGLTEARNDADLEFEESRLREAIAAGASLPAQALGEKLLREVARFEGSRRPLDDQSIVVIRREG